jgi:phosphatidylglycerol:prolipoprotein diacylglycerol transferase
MDNFLRFWQHLPSSIDPVVFQVGGFKLHYYGLMYMVAFGITYALALFRVKSENRRPISIEELQSLLTAMIVGLIVGARLGYVFFYNLGYYVERPWEILLPFEFNNGIHFTGISGMSYHGGLIGAVLGGFIYIRRRRLNFRDMGDLLIPCIPLGYTFGRLGNFINGELWGRVTDAAIGMYFPNAPGKSLRHPSQLYEAFGEGVLLFAVLWFLRNRVRLRGAMLPIYLIGYGAVRFVIEFFRQPDQHLGFIVFSFSMGQLLCMGMILAGVVWLPAIRNLATRETIASESKPIEGKRKRRQS